MSENPDDAIDAMIDHCYLLSDQRIFHVDQILDISDITYAMGASRRYGSADHWQGDLLPVAYLRTIITSSHPCNPDTYHTSLRIPKTDPS